MTGVAEELGVPEAAAPRHLRTRSYSRGGQTFVDSPFVDDYPRGNVYRAFAEADRREDVLVMYYAPWDADSRAARQASVPLILPGASSTTKQTIVLKCLCYSTEIMIHGISRF